MTDKTQRDGRQGKKTTAIQDSSSSGMPAAHPSGSADADPSDDRWVRDETVPMGDDTISEGDDGSGGSGPTQPSLILEPPPRSHWFSVLWLLLACVAFWGIGSATVNLVELWQRNIMLAAPLGVIALILVALLARALWTEWAAMRDVDALAERREAVQKALDNEDLIALEEALEPTLTNLRVREPALINEFEAAAVDLEDCSGYLRCLDNIVLHSLDAEAKRVVENGAIATGAAVAIVPHPAFDAIVVLWRALVMTRRIGAIYGLRPGGLASWRLLSHTLKSALLAASMETLTTLLADSFSTTLARTLKPIAEGTVIAVRIYHLGRLTVAACRPVSRSHW